MRIVAGKYKGTHLQDFDISTTKPTLDRVRVSIGNILQPYLSDAIVLDLFSGSGWFALEALSRGAKTAFAVDSNGEAIKLIKANFLKLKQDTSKLIHADYTQFLRQAKNDGLKFDVIFLDPPYETDYAQRAVDFILGNGLLASGGVIMRESDSKSASLILPPNVEYQARSYGRPRLEWIKV